MISSSAADKGFHALAFAADGTDVVDGVLRSGLFAGSAVDFDRPLPTRPGLIPPREGFTAVFSRSEDRAFVLGGRDRSTGEALHDLRRPLRVSVRHWPGALAGAPFADAAGYSFALRGPEGTAQLERRTELGLLSAELSEVGSVL